ncbi:hypothetical protein ALQ64_03152 [Pseudomonas cannabina]|uniref:Uncharacterized protein n=1 Tax=Pseudomonas cannabina TaxID=86840 RepID=A0A3M3K1V6_PSECA|nr:hypothetical protein [Pseudomonas cannabina]RMN17108.1 hypothetical protein ALQ64_03152 [Pseudomonas cannabina]
MKISDLQKVLDEKMSLHGDIDIVCITAPCNDPYGVILSVEELRVSSPEMLGMNALGLADDAKVLAIGYGDGA